MGDVRVGGIVAVWAGVGDGVYGEDVGVVEALVLVWVESRGIYGVRGKKGRGFSFFLSEDLWVWGSNGRECDSISINFMRLFGEWKERKRIIYNLQKDKRTSARTYSFCKMMFWAFFRAGY